jgi:hypothetical protein
MNTEAPPAQKKRKTAPEATKGEAPVKKSKPAPGHPEPDDLEVEGGEDEDEHPAVPATSSEKKTAKTIEPDDDEYDEVDEVAAAEEDSE